MTTTVLIDAFSYVHGYDFTVDTNQITLTNEAAALDRTTFRSGGWTELKGGLKSVSLGMSGFWSSSDTAGEPASDRVSFADLGVRDRVFTIGASETEGFPCFMFKAGHFNYQAFGTVGELAPFSLTSNGTGSTGVVRGQLAAAMQSATATGALGSGVELGTVAAGKSLYGTVHVFDVGTSVEVELYSATDDTFGTKTLRATTGSVTAPGGYWLTPVAGPITHEFYRFEVKAITGTAQIGGAIGIG